MRRLKNINNLVKTMYKRDHLKRKAIKLNDESLWLLYKQTRNCITNSIRTSKITYYETCINHNKGKVKNLWKVLRQLTTNRTAMIRCCLCMRWHHTECVCIDNSDEIGCWPCPDCRNIAADMKLMREAGTTTMETTNATIRQLAYNINIISDTLSQRNFECERLLSDNCDLRHKITLLTTENNVQQWGRLMRHKTLLVGDSLLKKIDEEKLNATKVDAVSGTTVKEVLHRLQAQTAKYENIIVCAGTNDCSDADIDEQRFEATYRVVVKSAKELVLDGRDVRISSIPPRNDSPRKNERVTRANNAIKALSERTGVSYIDNGPSFKLEDGSVNDGYLAKDGLHLTVARTNRLVINLKLATKNDDVTKSDHSYVRQRHSKPVPGAGQHDERHHPRRDAARGTQLLLNTTKQTDALSHDATLLTQLPSDSLGTTLTTTTSNVLRVCMADNLLPMRANVSARLINDRPASSTRTNGP